VSEESGAVSLARGGRLTRGVARDRLKRHLTNYLVRRRNAYRPGALFRLGPSRGEADAPVSGEM